MVDWGALLKWVGISVGVGLAIIIVVVILLCYFVYKRMTGANFKGETGAKNRPSPKYSCSRPRSHLIKKPDLIKMIRLDFLCFGAATLARDRSSRRSHFLLRRAQCL